MGTIQALTYIDVIDATTYFQTRLNSSTWFDADVTDQDRLAALVTATRRIDNLNFMGSQALYGQLLQWPRLGLNLDPTTIPDDILIATCELAYALLDGADANMEVESIASTSDKFSSVGDTYNRGFVLDHIRAGIPSLEAWQHLVPYLVDPNLVTLRRTC